MTISEQLRKLLAEATPGDWTAAIWRHSGKPDTVCVKRGGDEIIGWNGFDGVPCTKAEIRANAALIVFLHNNAPHFATLEEENVRLREAALGLKADLLNRAEWCPDAGKVVCAGNGAWSRFCAALQEQPK